MAALQAADMASEKLVEMEQQLNGLGREVSSLQSFRDQHIRDHEKESKLTYLIKEFR